MNICDIEYLRSIFNYQKDTGEITYKENTKIKSKNKNTIGTIDKYGYLILSVLGKRFKSHRVAWAMHYGEWPNKNIDHINGNKIDNRIENLRECNNLQNNQNRRRAQKTSNVGLIGVSKDKSTGRYRARIRINGKRVSLGCFETAEEASIEYVLAKRKHHDFCSI